MISSTIQSLLDSCSRPDPHFPPTLLYNEGWMLRLVLHWFASHPIANHPMACPEDGTWFSEALLPSPFLPRFRGDPLCESRTHADGVVGHLTIGKQGKADLALCPTATHFVVYEAKLFSSLSADVKNVPGFDQAARNIACMVEVLCRAGADSARFEQLGFYVLAPHSQVAANMFRSALDRESVYHKIEARVQQYQGERDAWFADWFSLVFPRIEVKAVAWEEVIALICENDPGFGSDLQEFYERCLRYNQPARLSRDMLVPLS